MRTLLSVVGLMLHLGLQAQLFHKVYGSENVAYPSFAAAPDAFYLAHGSDHELIKTDLDGQLIWSRRLEFNGTPVGIFRIAWLNGALLVSGGHVAQQNFIAALDPDGNVLWSNAASFGDINTATRIHAVNDNYITVGHREYPTGGGWTFDITMCRWDVDGELLWANATGDNTYDYFGWTSLVLPGGDILVAGERADANGSQPLLARYNADGDLLWMKLLADEVAFYTYTGPTDLIATTDGNYALVATTYNTFFNNDAHVMSFDGDGNVLWAHRMYQVGWTERGGSILQDGQQLLVSGTHFEGNVFGAQVARFALDGTPADVKTLPNFRSTSASGYYAGQGQELVSFAPDQYVLAGECFANYPGPSWHGFSTFQFDVDPACSPATPYPFQYTATVWLDSLITDAAVSTNITETPATITSATITTTTTDLCTLLGVEAHAPHVQLSLFPNPAGTACTLDLPAPPTAPVRVHDALGRTVTVPVRWTGPQEALLDLAELLPGVYTVRVQLADGAHDVRLIKE